MADEQAVDGDGTISMSPSSTLATLREAARQVEHEDYLDGQAAITAAIGELVEEHGIQEVPNITQEENVDTNLPKLSKPNRRASVNEDARMLMQQMGVTFAPKPSESIAIEKDVNDLVSDMNKKQEPQQVNETPKKPMNPRYLHALESKKRQQKSMNQSRTSSTRISTTLSDISKVLIESEDARWCEQFSQTTFKSYNEEMLFRNMQKVIPPKLSSSSSSSSSSSKKFVSPHEINRQTMKQKKQEFHESWSHLRKGGRDGRGGGREGGYMRYDDIENCTFQPKTNTSQNNNQGGGGGGGGNDPDDDMIQSGGSKFENFIARQEAKERSRRQDNEFTKGKEDYEKYELDKKYCPRCGGKQSYDEVKEKRKNCPNCHVAYRPRNCWGDIEDGFYNRQNEHWVRCQENEVKRRMETEKESQES
jgi:ribosomal protein S27AE/Rod binding domain-containing protein